MTIHSLIIRSRKLRQELDEVGRLSPHDQMIVMAQKIEDIKTVLKSLEHFSEGTHNQYTWLLEQVWNIFGLLTRDSTGHAWKKDFPDKPAATEFYQQAIGLMRFLKSAK